MPTLVLSGNAAQSYAVRLARVPVISAYPITPQTTIVETLAQFVSDGSLSARFVPVESEHSALMVVVSAAALGVRTYTATSSQGLLLMHELLHWASGLRSPVVMGVVNRAVAPPWNIGADHSDTMAQRDTGWIQFYVESNQEVLDTVLEAYRLAEDPEIRLPAMVCEDAFYLSHTVEPVDVPEPSAVDAFLPPRSPRGVLTPGVPSRVGSFTGPAEYVGFRRGVADAMARVPAKIAEVEAAYARATGRELGGLLPLYRTEGADAVLVTMGTTSTTARSVVDELRAEGQKVGLAKLRVFRPFPQAELQRLAAEVDRIGVLDRSYTFGGLGAAATETRAAVYPTPHRPLVASYLTGIGGRDVTPSSLRAIFASLLDGRVPEPAWTDLDPLPKALVHG
jgi:2-oxoisovalerate ferredoxin oxidoreductase alpha subunit